MMFLHIFPRALIVLSLVHMCSKIFLILQTDCIQLKVLFGQKLDMNLSVEVCTLQGVDCNDELRFLGPCEQYARFLSISCPDIRRYVPTSNSASIIRVPWAINPPRSLRRERTLAWRTYVDARSANGRHHPSSYEA